MVKRTTNLSENKKNRDLFKNISSSLSYKFFSFVTRYSQARIAHHIRLTKSSQGSVDVLSRSSSSIGAARRLRRLVNFSVAQGGGRL